MPVPSSKSIGARQAGIPSPITLEKRLETFFKNSPWTVRIQEMAGEKWYTFQRIKNGDRAEEIIYLGKVDARHTVAEVKGKHSDPNFLLIPTQGSNPFLYVDRNGLVVRSPDTGNSCDYPLFVAIPQKANISHSEIRYNKLFYKLSPIDELNLHREPALFAAIDVRCFEKPSPESYTPVKRSKTCLVYDTSGSMGTVALERQSQIVAANAITLIDRLKIADPNSVASKTPAIYSLGIFLNRAGSSLKKDYLLDPKTLAGILDPKAWLFAEVEKLAKSGPTFTGPDDLFYPSSDPTVFEKSNKCDSMDIISDSHGEPSTAQSPQVNGHYAYFGDYTQAPQWAIRHKMPLFIAIKLFDGDFNQTDFLSEAAKKGIADRADLKKILEAIKRPDINETYLHHILPSLVDATLSDQMAIMPQLESIIKNENYDGHVRKRAIALLAVWASRGNVVAHRLLLSRLTSLSDRGSDLDVRNYLAKAVSMIITDDESSALAEKVKKNPISPLNTLYLIAQAGKPSFAVSFKFILNHVWSRTIVNNPANGELGRTLSVLFDDPIMQYDLKDMSPEKIQMLAGTPWQAKQLQEIFEIFDADILPTLTQDMQPIVSIMVAYAITYLNPPWEEGRAVVLNIIPKSRYHYRIPMVGVEQELSAIVRTANWENSWLYFEHGEKDKKLPHLFEDGLLKTTGSVMSKSAWTKVDGTLKGELKDKDGDGLVGVHYHLHPWNDQSLPQEISMFPSAADFSSAWFYFLIQFRSRYPKGQCEFKIVSPVGITSIQPTEELLGLVDAMIKNKSSEIPPALLKTIKEYDKYIRANWGLARDYEIESIFRKYYKIQFRRKNNG